MSDKKDFAAKLAALIAETEELNAEHIARISARRTAVEDFLSQSHVVELPELPRVNGHTEATVAEFARTREGRYAVMPVKTADGYTLTVVLVYAPTQKNIDEKWVDIPTASIQARYVQLGLFTDLDNEVHLSDTKTAEGFKKTAARLEKTGNAAPTGEGAQEVLEKMSELATALNGRKGRNR